MGPTAEQSTPYRDDFAETVLKLPPPLLDYLRRAAIKRGVSTGDMVRIALGTFKFLDEQSQRGASVLLQEKDKTNKVTI